MNVRHPWKKEPKQLSIHAVGLFLYTPFLYKHILFLGQPQYAYDSSNLDITLCLQHA